VYSCISSLSFTEIDRFIDKIHKLAPHQDDRDPLVVLAGNKCDLEDDRAVTTQQGRAKAESIGIPFFECSAKSNINVSVLFETSLKQLVGKSESRKGEQGKDDEIICHCAVA
jgi:GTPase SAR1 family protein